MPRYIPELILHSHCPARSQMIDEPISRDKLVNRHDDRLVSERSPRSDPAGFYLFRLAQLALEAKEQLIQDERRYRNCSHRQDHSRRCLAMKPIVNEGEESYG